MAIDLSARVAASNAAPYSLPPFSTGITAADSRAIHHEHAQRVRWWKAVSMPAGATTQSNGKRYFEQTLDDSVRAFIFSNERNLNDEEFGTIVVGDVRFSSMPDEIDLSKDDRILQLDYPKPAEAKVSFGDDEATLPRLFIASVDGIYDAVGLVDSSDYEVEGRVITWIGAGSAPSQITVRYHFLPQYEFKGDGDRQAFLGADGGRVPQIVPLHLIEVGREIE